MSDSEREDKLIAAERDKAVAENKILRMMLWLRHGCESPALYGDDGEMQCNNCLIDFKRIPASQIDDRFVQEGTNQLWLVNRLQELRVEANSRHAMIHQCAEGTVYRGAAKEHYRVAADAVDDVLRQMGRIP